MTDLEVVRDMKEKLCHAAYHLESERKLARETTVQVKEYTFPDGTSVKVGQERFEATEINFDPSIIDVECKGLSDLVFDTIQKFEFDCRLQYYEHILLSYFHIRYYVQKSKSDSWTKRKSRKEGDSLNDLNSFEKTRLPRPSKNAIYGVFSG